MQYLEALCKDLGKPHEEYSRKLEKLRRATGGGGGGGQTQVGGGKLTIRFYPMTICGVDVSLISMVYILYIYYNFTYIRYILLSQEPNSLKLLLKHSEQNALDQTESKKKYPQNHPWLPLVDLHPKDHNKDQWMTMMILVILM